VTYAFLDPQFTTSKSECQVGIKMREEREKRLEVSGRKRVKNACALSLPIMEETRGGE